jgi:hypothetical protein
VVADGPAWSGIRNEQHLVRVERKTLRERMHYLLDPSKAASVAGAPNGKEDRPPASVRIGNVRDAAL